tara:strand:+ start:379 stop:540 length:162 start_codon:yes stop_codon:yes gene_type:complete
MEIKTSLLSTKDILQGLKFAPDVLIVDEPERPVEKPFTKIKKFSLLYDKNYVV